MNEDKETDYISNITPLETQGKVLCLRPARQGNNIYCIKEASWLTQNNCQYFKYEPAED